MYISLVLSATRFFLLFFRAGTIQYLIVVHTYHCWPFLRTLRRSKISFECCTVDTHLAGLLLTVILE